MSNNHRNYNAMSNKPKETTQYEPNNETLVTEGNVVNDTPSYNVQAHASSDGPSTVGPGMNNPEPPKEPVYGVVTNCDRLNIRSKPTKDSDVVMVIKNGMKAPIDLSKSTEDWYYVGSGYVMKDYITIK